MPDEKSNLYLFEAIELRAEYDARLKTLVGLLPESQQAGRRAFAVADTDSARPVEALNVEELRDQIEALRAKRRKLNAALQRANHESTIEVGADKPSLAEALELRKEANQEIAELAAQLKEAAYVKVIYKEERDIVEEPKQDLRTVRTKLEAKRLLFRELNRALQRANHEVTVGFKDEPTA
jgi:chromosome segregation ATPase